jgi:CubicO group peptidase (beta-lactamase class C family)
MPKISSKPGSSLLAGTTYTERLISFIIKDGFQNSVEDHRLFPYRIAEKAAIACKIIKSDNPVNTKISYLHKGIKQTSEIDDLMKATETNAFLVMKVDKLTIENYYNGYKRDSLFRVFSVTKSFTSALIGIAINEGYIKNINDSITDFLPELKRATNASLITIKHLLLMNSGIHFNDKNLPWSESIKTYLHPNTRKFALNCQIGILADYFFYNDYHPILLGMVLERSTGKVVTEYFQKKIWNPMGSEFDAIFSCDSEKHMFEKPESGLNMTALDLLRFGLLFLNNGKSNNNQVIPESWIYESTSPILQQLQSRYYYYRNRSWGNLFFNKPDNYYKYFWWGTKISEKHYDYFALGIRGQVLYISPRNNAIAIRLGKNWNVRDWWPRILRDYIDSI